MKLSEHGKTFGRLRRRFSLRALGLSLMRVELFRNFMSDLPQEQQQRLMDFGITVLSFCGVCGVVSLLHRVLQSEFQTPTNEKTAPKNPARVRLHGGQVVQESD